MTKVKEPYKKVNNLYFGGKNIGVKKPYTKDRRLYLGEVQKGGPFGVIFAQALPDDRVFMQNIKE